MNSIEIKNVSFKYEESLILEKVSFSIKKNDFIGIIGPNGGGKTTLLKLIMGFIKPNKGKIKIFGQEPQYLRHKIGYVPQCNNVDRFFPITVLELVLLGALQNSSWFGKYSPQTKQKAKSLLKKVGLLDFQDSPFGKLSGGQAQRALIARALISDPEILILDEPTANIDSKSEQKIFDLLLSANRTILMVSHDLETILNKVQKVICVQRKVNFLKLEEICEHFALGLYHSPIRSKEK